jgi:uncharacterized protein YpbB
MSKHIIKKYLKEWSENENPLEELAKLVAKGSKYENKKIAMFLKKVYGVEEKNLTIDQVMDMLEDHNFHAEYAMVEALKKKNDKKIDLFIAIATEHNKIGSLPFDLGALRYYISNPKSMVKTYTIDDHYKGMKISASTMKIVKMLPPKQQKEFLGVFE